MKMGVSYLILGFITITRQSLDDTFFCQVIVVLGRYFYFFVCFFLCVSLQQKAFSLNTCYLKDLSLTCRSHKLTAMFFPIKRQWIGHIMWPMILRNCLPNQKGSLKFPKGGCGSSQPRNVTRIICFNLPNPLEENIITNRYSRK